MQYRFDAFEVDTEAFALRENGQVHHVEPLVFDLICFFAQNPGRVLSRQDIIDAVWKGRIVSDATISSCIKSARKALGDSGSKQSFIRTVRGRGFQFACEVDHIETAGERDAASVVPRPIQVQQPSLIILPFQVFGGAGDFAPIADGLVENLTTVLTRIPFVSIASRTTSFAFRDAAVTARRVHDEFGIDYMLEGSLQQQGPGLRANVQLIETANDRHLWAEQFDAAGACDAVNDLLHAILPKLEPQIVRAVFQELQGNSGEMSSQQLLIKSMGLLALKGWHRASFTEAANMLRRAIEGDPDRALAHAYLALILALGHRVGLLERSRDVVQGAVDAAERALDIDDMDSNVVGLAGCALADAGQAERAVPLLKRALELNPNNAQAWTALGSAFAILGQPQEAIEPLKRGIEISPMDGRLAVWNAVLALVHLQLGDLDRAREAAEAGCQSDEKTYLPHVVAAAVGLVAKKPDEALLAIQRGLRVKPDLSPQEVDCLVGPKLGAAIAQLRSDM